MELIRLLNTLLWCLKEVVSNEKTSVNQKLGKSSIDMPLNIRNRLFSEMNSVLKKNVKFVRIYFL